MNSFWFLPPFALALAAVSFYFADWLKSAGYIEGDGPTFWVGVGFTVICWTVVVVPLFFSILSEQRNKWLQALPEKPVLAIPPISPLYTKGVIPFMTIGISACILALAAYSLTFVDPAYAWVILTAAALLVVQRIVEYLRLTRLPTGGPTRFHYKGTLFFAKELKLMGTREIIPIKDVRDIKLHQREIPRTYRSNGRILDMDITLKDSSCLRISWSDGTIDWPAPSYDEALQAVRELGL